MLTIDIFCKVIDNYGDAGVCLHLARTLSQKEVKVTLWCDQLKVLEQIQNHKDSSTPTLQLKEWRLLTTYDCPDAVINAFNCHLDPAVLHAIQAKERSGKPAVVINLDYLSAEDWVEGCHGLTSYADGISCYYFFPGFTNKTGGLNVDPTFVKQCKANLQKIVLETIQHAEQKKTAQNITLFSYNNPALIPLLNSFTNSSNPIVLTVFQGLALDNLNHLLSLNLHSGQSLQLGKLTIHASAMVEQQEYDNYLLTNQCNLVRGEDSIIRAMHTGRPFLWQIYKQEENAHIVKLESFLYRMHSVLSTSKDLAASTWEKDFFYLKQCMLAYNEAAPYPDNFSFEQFMQHTKPLFYHFAQYLCSQEPLSVRLLAFIEEKLNIA